MPQQRFQVANMSYLQISGLKISYGDKVVLHNIDLAVEQGEMIALLGPSGCGKTTLLNALCGFIPVQSGEVAIASRTITHLAPEQRNITMVFQSYALWPHLTVARNIGYGLKLRKWRGADITRRVAELLRIVNLDGLADVKVTELSGGQRQRVALARALACPAQPWVGQRKASLAPCRRVRVLACARPMSARARRAWARRR